MTETSTVTHTSPPLTVDLLSAPHQTEETEAQRQKPVSWGCTAQGWGNLCSCHSQVAGGSQPSLRLSTKCTSPGLRGRGMATRQGWAREGTRGQRPWNRCSRGDECQPFPHPGPCHTTPGPSRPDPLSSPLCTMDLGRPARPHPSVYPSSTSLCTSTGDVALKDT